MHTIFQVNLKLIYPHLYKFLGLKFKLNPQGTNEFQKN